MIKEITLKEYKNGIVLIDFFATWCGPCKMLAPVLEEFTSETNIPVLKVDIDKEEEFANLFNIQAVPTVFVLEDGKVINKAMGYQTKNNLLKLIKK